MFVDTKAKTSTTIGGAWPGRYDSSGFIDPNVWYASTGYSGITLGIAFKDNDVESVQNGTIPTSGDVNVNCNGYKFAWVVIGGLYVSKIYFADLNSNLFYQVRNFSYDYVQASLSNKNIRLYNNVTGAGLYYQVFGIK